MLEISTSILGIVILSAGGSALASNASAAEAPPPQTEIDPGGTTLYLDQGRLELRGAGLRGVRVEWRAGARAGEDSCVAPSPSGSNGKVETCAFAVPKDLPADATFAWSSSPPAGAAAGGKPPEALRPAKIVVDHLLSPAAAVDLSSGIGRLPVTHAEAVSAVDCTPARCESDDGAIVVRAVSGAATSLTLRFRLSPHFFIARGDALDTVLSRAVPVVHCGATIVSGAPLRRSESTRIIVRVDGRCAADARELRWTVNGDAARLERVERALGSTFVQLGVGDVEDAQVTVLATRPEPDGSVIATAHVDTRPAPQPRATLEIPGFGRIPFIPTNREADLRTPSVGEHARLVPLPVEGAYTVSVAGRALRVQGEDSAGGFVSLRFGYRLDTLPAPFAATDLAIVTEAVQRPVREASVPIPLGASLLGPAPLIELLCADASGRVERIAAGPEQSIPYAQRDSCHLVIHRERFKPEDGTQDVTVDVSVTKVDDSSRADSHLSERMILRAGAQPRVFWIHGVHAPFDRITVRITHVVDEAHDVGGAEVYANLPAAQWSLVVGQGHLRFYATAAIPTGLFRITAPSDVLTLNFGALSRLTWLDREGHEGLAGLELGAMGIGLAATPGFPRTLAILGGVGVGVPIGNRGEPSQASVNLHAWIAYELRDEYFIDQKDQAGPLASHWSFLFGPSITIGNVGTNL
ncbi:MAG TPA: hypothetical protein VHL80_01050 [Polyangia bacterium]|nr:hypothetical protein [Polyangia bacterium]